MKELAETLRYRIKINLTDMRKSEMTLTERIKYERAMIQIEMLESVIRKLQ